MRTETKKILIVEDNLIQVKVVKIFFKKLGFEADHTMDGNEALELVKKNRYIIIYMDIGLLTIPGDETCRLIREYERQNNLDAVPIIAVTANDDPSEFVRYKKEGMQEVITKPLTMEKAEYFLSFRKE